MWHTGLPAYRNQKIEKQRRENKAQHCWLSPTNYVQFESEDLDLYYNLSGRPWQAFLSVAFFLQLLEIRKSQETVCLQ